MKSALDRLRRLIGEEEEEEQSAVYEPPANARSKAAYNELMETGKTTYGGRTYTLPEGQLTGFQKRLNDYTASAAPMAVAKAAEQALDTAKSRDADWWQAEKNRNSADASKLIARGAQSVLNEKKEPEPKTYQVQAPATSRALTPDIEAEYQRRNRATGQNVAPGAWAQSQIAKANERQTQAEKNRNAMPSGWKDVGTTIAGTAANVVSGVGSPLVIMARLMEMPDDILYAITGNERFNLDRAPGLRDSTALQENDSFAQAAQNASDKVGDFGKMVISTGKAAGNMMSWNAVMTPAFAALGNTGVLSGLKNVAESSPLLTSAASRRGAKVALDILTNPGNFGISLGSAVNSYSEKREQGANMGQAIANGLYKGVLEYMSNKLSSGTPFEDLPGEQGYVSRLVENVTRGTKLEELLKVFNQSTGGKVFNWFADKAGEGIEEWVTGFADPWIDRLTYDWNTDLATGRELWDEFAGGVLLSFFMSGGEAMLNKISDNGQIQKAKVVNELVKQGMSRESARTYADSITKAANIVMEAGWQGNDYNSITARLSQNPDYAQKSQGNDKTAAQAKESDSESLKRYADIYNRGETMASVQNGADPSSVNAAAFVNDLEAGNYFYIWDTQGARAADAYYDQYVQAVANRRKYQTVETVRKEREERQRRDAERAAQEAEIAAREAAFQTARAQAEQNARATENITQENVPLAQETAQSRATPPLPQQAAQITPESVTTPPVPGNAQRAAEGTGADTNGQERTEEVPHPALRATFPQGKAEAEERNGPPLPQRAGEESQTLGNPGRLRVAAREQTENQESGSGLRIVGTNRQQQKTAQQRQLQEEGNRAESLRARGFQNAGEGETVYVRSEERWDAEERAVAAALRENGIEPTFVTGLLQDADGKRVTSLMDGEKIAIQADNRSQTVQSIAERATGLTLDAAGDTLNENRNGGLRIGRQTENSTAAEAGGGDGGRTEIPFEERQRFSGQRAGEQAGGLGQGAENGKPVLGQVHKASDRRSYAEAHGKVTVYNRGSGKSLGIRAAAESSKSQIASEKQVQEDEELRSISEAFKQATGLPVSFTFGTVQLANGREARGVYTGKRFVVQCDDDTYTASQLALHELYHYFADKNPGLNAKLKERILKGNKGQALDETLRRYIEELGPAAGLSENMGKKAYDKAVDKILEEVFADAYAGINDYGARASQFIEEARQTERDFRSSENAAATAQRTGPPKQKSTAGLKKDLRDKLLSTFHTPDGYKQYLGNLVNEYADRILEKGSLTDKETTALFDALYEEGSVKTAADEVFREARNTVRGAKIYVPESIKHEFGDDWRDFQRRAFGQGILLTNNPADQKLDVYHMEIANAFPYVFDPDETDMRTILETIVNVADSGKGKTMSLRDYGTSMEAALQDGWAYDSREEQQAELRRAMEEYLREFADQAGGERFSLREFKDGKRFVDVQTDQAMFDNLSDTEKLALARIIIKQRFAGKVIGIDNQAFVNGRTAEEYSRIKKPLPEANTGIMDAKARVSTELDNLIDAGFNFRTAEDGADGHTHDTLTGPYNYFDAIFKVGDEYFQGVVNLENNRNGRRFKDVTKIKNITKDTAGSYGENPTTRFLRDVSMPRIAGEEEKSNSESQEKKKVFNRTALVTEETVDRWLKDYASKGSPKYAQAYITRMTPDQFLKLTTSISGRLTIGQQTEELDPEKLIAATQQNPLQLIIRDGEVEGHEGRHRANALLRAGVESIPVLVFDSSNKYSKESVPEMQLMGQDFGKTRSYAIETLRDLTPLNYENRDKIVREYGVQPATERLREKYSDTDTIRFSLKGQTGAEQAAAQEARTLGSREVLDTPALKKLGVKVSGSVGDYGKTESLIAKDRAAKSLQKEARRAEKRLRATDAEKDFANGITAGIYREEDIPKRLNKDTVMELADYYWAMNSANLQTLHQLRADINAGLRDEAEGFLAEADIKPISMIELNERTPERAFRKMFGEKAQGITKWLLDPVRENEAEKIRWYNQQMDAVRKFTDSKGKSRELTRAESALTMRLMEGRAAADMVAGMETKAAIENAAANIRKGGDAADAAREFSLSSEERDLAEKYAGWLDTQEELKTADSTIVEAAAKKYAELFDDYYGAINDFLVAHGYEPIGYIKGYAPHMQPEENQSLLEKAFEKMGINAAVTELPASIAGQTTFFKPNKRWNPYFLQRNGSEANYDIVKAYQSYVDYMADILYHTDDIMRVRQTANWIRQTYAPEEIRQQLEWARELRQAPMEDKQRLLRDAGEIGQSTVLSAVDTAKAMQDYTDKLYERISNSTKNSNLVMWLDNYANILAGKQSFADRGWEYSTGRKSLNLANKLNNAFQKANVAGNLSSILNQTAQLPMIYAELGERDFLKAVADLANRNTRVWAQDSDFLTAKEGKELLYTDNADKFINALFAPAGYVDHLVSTVAVRGAFNKAIRQGASYAEAMQRADAFGQAVMGSRAKGSRPLAYESKGFFSKMVHMFQIEAVNSWDHLVSDLPREIRSIAKKDGKGKAAMALAGLILRALIGAFTLNRLTDELYGGTPAPFDVLGLTANFVASGKGLSTNAYIRTIIDNTMEKMGHERLFGTEPMTKEDFDLEAAADDLLYNVMNDVPLVRNAAGVLGLGDQTVPLPGAGGEFKNLGTAVKNLLKEGVEPGEIGNLLKAMGLAATQFIPGGRQISKTAQGAEAIIRGGSYNGYKKPKLQYPLEGATDLVKALMFGKNATNAAKEYWAAGGNALTEKQTALYTALASHGVGRKEAYDAIQRYREIANDDSMTRYERGKAERALLAGLGISDEDKLDMYRELNNAESTAAKFRAIMETGLSFDQVMTIQDKYAEIDGKEGLKAGDKAKEFYLWVDNQSYTANQKTEIKDQLKYFQSIPAEAERYENLKGRGLSPDAAASVDNAITALNPLPGHEGVTDAQKWNAGLKALGSKASNKDKLAVVGSIVGTNMTTDSGEPSRWAKINRAVNDGKSVEDTMAMIENGTFDTYIRWMDSDARTAGVKSQVYIDFREATKDMKSDKDSDGKTISGSLKNKVVAYIDSLDLTADQKDILLTDYNSSYSHKDVTWHNGSYGGSGSGSYAPARLRIQRKPWEAPKISGLKLPTAPKTETPRSGLRIRGKEDETKPVSSSRVAGAQGAPRSGLRIRAK